MMGNMSLHQDETTKLSWRTMQFTGQILGTCLHNVICQTSGVSFKYTLISFNFNFAINIKKLQLNFAKYLHQGGCFAYGIIINVWFMVVPSFHLWFVKPVAHFSVINLDFVFNFDYQIKAFS